MAERSDPFRPRKRLGQHFLVDPNTVRKIVAEVDAPDHAVVVEIGPGRGALTGALLTRYPDMIAVEVDPRSVAYLSETYPALDVRQGDVLDVDWRVLSGDPSRPLFVVGNLPYNITSQILFGLLEAHCVRRAVLTMQREVAERLVAHPRTKEYGILSVMVQLATTPSIRFHLSPNVFYPKPDVWSSTVRLDWLPVDSTAAGSDDRLLRRVVRAAFNQRRKMLRNSLAAVVEEFSVDLPVEVGSRRAEELSPAEFLRLTEHFLSSRA